MFIFERGTFNTLEILSGKSETFPFNLFRLRESVSWDPQKTKSNIRRSKKINCMLPCTEMYRRVFFTIYGNVPKKTISKVIWAGKGALVAILSQINKKFGDQFHFQWHRRRLNYQFFNYVTDKVNGSRVQPSLFGEDQRPEPGDGGNRAYTACYTVANSKRQGVPLLVEYSHRIVRSLYYA